MFKTSQCASMCAVIVLTTAQVVAGTFEVTSSTVDCGGGTSESSTFELSGTIGQLDVGPAPSSASFELVGGFWMAGAEQSCPADIVGGNGVVDVFDLLELLANWGSNGTGANIAQPPNNIVDVFDLLDLLSAWGSC